MGSLLPEQNPVSKKKKKREEREKKQVKRESGSLGLNLAQPSALINTKQRDVSLLSHCTLPQEGDSHHRR